MTLWSEHRCVTRSLGYGSLSLLALSLSACSFNDGPVYTEDTPPGVQVDSGTNPATTPIATGSSDDPVTSDPAGRPSANADDDAGTSSPTTGPAPDAGRPVAPGDPTSFDCGSSAQRFVAIAQATCASCHGPGSPGDGAFSTVLNIPALISSGKVVPGNPQSSPLFVQITSGAMPPKTSTARPTQDDVETIRGWINCGSPSDQAPVCQADCTTFVDISTRLNLIDNDLKALASADERADVRYLDLTNYANAGHGQRELDLYRDAVSFAVNALSDQPLIVVPTTIDSQKLLFRIRLSQYGWTPAQWEQLVAAYPYDVDYDADSRTFPVDNNVLDRIRQQTVTGTPFIQADWFFTHAVRPPLYHTLLGVPDTFAQLEAALGVDVADNIANQRVARAGFQESGPSHFNRVIERHAVNNDNGALWLTYDFNAGSGFSNIFTHPLDFRQTSSEIFFSLPNGLYGYMITDDRGVRLDKAPNAAVQDSHANDFAIESGISCMNCHAQTGVNPKYDEVHTAATVSSTDVATADAILALYKDNAALEALYATDRARYQAAVKATGMQTFTEGSAHELDDAYTGQLNSKVIAGVLGITDTQLRDAINTSPGLFPAEALALRATGATMPRDRFETLFPQLVSALGLGTPRAQ